MKIIKKKIYFVSLFISSCCLLVLIVFKLSIPEVYISPYPNGKNFAFTIVDDPDGATVNRVSPIYEFFYKIGVRTTIACWVYKPVDLGGLPDPQEQLSSETLENENYLKFITDYQTRGFEIALHTVTSGNDKREMTLGGYEKFRDLLGEYPKINIMHSKNLENIYWGKNVFKSPIMQWIVRLYDKIDYSGENNSSEYFWGDICKDNTRYVRLWGTSGINTLKFNPSMPYHDINKPLVNYWFSFSDGYNCYFFNKLLSEKNVRRLVKERGASIVYAHLAAGFCKKNMDGGYILNDDTKAKLLYLTRQKEGWFVPVSEILDRLLDIKNISIVKKKLSVEIFNNNIHSIRGVTLVTKPFSRYKSEDKDNLMANEDGEIIIGDLEPNGKKLIQLFSNFRICKLPKAPSLLEYVNLIWQRVKIMLLEHRG